LHLIISAVAALFFALLCADFCIAGLPDCVRSPWSSQMFQTQKPRQETRS
jgi:hypothetical protein